MESDFDKQFMTAALAEALKAAARREVPVGAVVVAENRILARAHNMRETLQDPTAHAEILALREAASVLGTWRLCDATLYCTLEPCCMCAGAMINARLKRVVYGASDSKSGACESVLRMFELKALNHSVESTGGVMAGETLKILQDFFREKRRP